MQDRDKWVKLCSDDLKSHLEGMIDAVFGPVEKKFVHPNIYLARERARTRGVRALIYIYRETARARCSGPLRSSCTLREREKERESE